jgi:hypothetical protein
VVASRLVGKESMESSENGSYQQVATLLANDEAPGHRNLAFLDFRSLLCRLTLSLSTFLRIWHA